MRRRPGPQSIGARANTGLFGFEPTGELARSFHPLVLGIESAVVDAGPGMDAGAVELFVLVGEQVAQQCEGGAQ